MKPWRLYSYLDESGRCCVRDWLDRIKPLNPEVDATLFKISVKNQLRAILAELQRCTETWEKTGFFKELTQRESALGQVEDECEGLGEILFTVEKQLIRILGRRDSNQRAFFIYYCGVKDVKGERTNPDFYKHGCREAKSRESEERLHELNYF